MPNTSEAYRQNSIFEFRNHVTAKLALQHVPREGEVPVSGNERTFNLGDMIHSNIIESRYFFKILDLHEFEDILEEIKNVVHDLEPLVVGSSRHPSSAFCILYLLSCKRLTIQEVNWMLYYMESPFIRGLGFLYLRFAVNPRELWKQFSPFFDDEMKIIPYADKVTTTIGRFVLSLLESKRYQSVILPMIPVALKREWDVNILKLETLNNRGIKYDTLHVGDTVMGFYSLDLMWYPAKIIKEIRSRGHILIDGEDPKEIRGKVGDDDENVKQMEKERIHSTQRSRSRSLHRHSRRSRSRSDSSDSRGSYRHSYRHSRSSSRSRSSRHAHRHHSSSPTGTPIRSDDINAMFDDKHLAEVVRERERNAAVTTGRVASTVGHVKSNMMLKMDKFTTVKTTFEPKAVVTNMIEGEDSVVKMQREMERKKREEENKKRLDAIQRMYSRNPEEDRYHQDYL